MGIVSKDLASSHTTKAMHTVVAPTGRLRMRRRVLTLAEVRLDLVPAPVIEAIVLRPLLIPARHAAGHQHGVDARGAAEALSRPDAVPPPPGLGHGLAVPGALDLQRVAHPEVLADERDPRHEVVLDVALLDHQHRDGGVLGQPRRDDAPGGSACDVVERPGVSSARVPRCSRPGTF